MLFTLFNQKYSEVHRIIDNLTDKLSNKFFNANIVPDAVIGAIHGLFV